MHNISMLVSLLSNHYSSDEGYTDIVDAVDTPPADGAQIPAMTMVKNVSYEATSSF